MNFKGLKKFIVIFGLLFLTFGGIFYAINGFSKETFGWSLLPSLIGSFLVYSMTLKKDEKIEKDIIGIIGLTIVVLFMVAGVFSIIITPFLKYKDFFLTILASVLIPFIWIWEKVAEIGFWGIAGWLWFLWVTFSYIKLCERVESINDKLDDLLNRRRE